MFCTRSSCTTITIYNCVPFSTSLSLWLTALFLQRCNEMGCCVAHVLSFSEHFQLLLSTSKLLEDFYYFYTLL